MDTIIKSEQLSHNVFRKLRGIVCVICGSKQSFGRVVGIQVNMHSHHIDHNRKNNSAENHMTLCSTCHGAEGGRWQKMSEEDRADQVHRWQNGYYDRRLREKDRRVDACVY